MTDKAVILHVFGKVQGVGFRFYTQKKAKELQIKGYVKNLPDGSVYIEAEGEIENLEVFMNWCELGPSWARVSKLTHQYVPPTDYSNFQIK